MNKYVLQTLWRKALTVFASKAQLAALANIKADIDDIPVLVTLQSAPTAATTTYTKNGATVDFVVGQMCRVANNGASSGYDFYLLKDLVTENNTTTAVWRKDVSADKEDKVSIVAPVNATDATQPITVLACEIGKYYRLDVAVETLAITLPAMTDLTTVRTVVIYLTAGTTPAVTITSADSKDVYYQDGFEIESGNTYEINALFNGSAWIVAAVKIVVPEAEEEGGE